MMRTSCDAIQNNVCGIYLIRNKINNKIYIGQSNDIHRRWLEHLRSGQPEKYVKKNERDSNLPIHRAMQKYGIKNFEIIVLEKCKKEELDQKEQEWILRLRSNDKDVGYNLTIGGQKNISLKGENHSQAKLTQKEVNEIVALLSHAEKSFSEISVLYHNISNATLCMINTGRIWHNDSLLYPIRKTYTGMRGSKNPRSQFSEKEVMELRTLYSQGYTLKNIPQRYKEKASYSAINAIFYGKSYKHLPIWNKKQKKWIEPCIDYSQS